MKKNVYTIDKVAEISRISVRALRHYDEIGLLKPLSRNESRHRIYSENELLRLQQILFYKELDFSLDEIKSILDDESFNLVDALEAHKIMLAQKQTQINALIRTIDKTILHLKGNRIMKDEELYEGFTKEEIILMNEDANKFYDPSLMAQSRKRDESRSAQEWNDLKQEEGEIMKELIILMDSKEISDPEVQKLVERQYAFISKFFTPTIEIFRAIGQGYAQDPRFVKFYDKYKKGLASYFQRAIDYYCDSKADIK